MSVTGLSAARLRLWWQETHSGQFELIRHFCGQFFESELLARPGQLKLLFGGVLSVLASLSILFLQAYYHKYLLLKHLDDFQPFRLAVLADALFFVSLTMAVIGLLTTLLWQSLFPERRDYLALGGLPLRMSEVFRAKFIALLGFVMLATIFLTAPPAIGMAWVMMPQRGTPHFQEFGGMSWHIPGLFLACLDAGLFVFFVLVTLQGVLLNVLPLRTSARVSLVLQGTLLIMFLAAIPLAIGIPKLTYSMTQRPDWAMWAPPLWFLGLEHVISSNTDPFATRLARCAIGGLFASALTAIAAYWWSYRRHRVRVLESAGASPSRGHGRWFATPDVAPRTLSVFAFTAKTFGRSPQHRLILTAFAGIAIAISAWIPSRTAAIAGQLTLSLFTLAGLTYLFRLPVEPRANWIFRVYETGHTVALLRGVEWFLIAGGVIPVTLLSFALNTVLLGPSQAMILTLLATPPALLLTEGLLFPFYKIPFTSLYLPARRMITETLIKYGVALVLYISILSAVLSWCSASPLRWVLAVMLMMAGYVRLRIVRLDVQRVGRLEFEELPDILVQTIDIERD